MTKKFWAILAVGLILAFPTPLRADQPSSKSSAGPIAEVKQRVDTDRSEVRVYQGKKLVQLARFFELYVVTPVAGPPSKIEDLTDRSVAIFRSEKDPAQWDVYENVWAGAGRELMLADNVFRVKQVLVSSAQDPIELRLDEKVVQLKPGDALLVL